MTGDLAVQRFDPGATLAADPLGFGQRLARARALADDGGQALRRRPHLFVEAEGLVAQLLQLHAHLLAALQQALELALDLLHRLPEVAQPMLAPLEHLALLGLARGQSAQSRAHALLAVAQAGELLGQRLGLGGEPGEVGGGQRQRELAALALQRLVLLRLARLPLQRSELAPHLVHDVAHAHQVLAGGVELALRLVALLLVARDAGRLLDEDAALVGLGGQDVIELVLVHDRVRARVGAGPGEEIEDVAQPGRLLVQQILALAGAVQASGDADLAPRHRQRAVVREHQLDLGQAERLAGAGALEDEVFHALAAQRLRALLAERPAHGLATVALPAAVRAHDPGDAGHDLDDGLLGERLETVQSDRL